MSDAYNSQKTVTHQKKCNNHCFYGTPFFALSVAIAVLLSVISFAGSVSAAGPGGPSGAVPMAYCSSLSKTMLSLPNPQPTGLIVHCFTDFPNGIIPYATNYLLTDPLIQGYFMSGVYAMVIFIITSFGIKVITGDAQRLKSDTFILLFKIGGVFYFLQNASYVYGQLLKIVTGLNTVMASAMQFASSGLFCSKTDLWASFDCLYAFMTGASFVSGIIVIIVVLALIAFVSMGMGVVVLFAFLYLLAALFGMLTRFLQIYLLSIMSLSFIFLVGYLFVPLLFFKNTFHYFQKWLAIVFAYVLLPIVLYGYMGFVFVGLDVSIFSGSTSIMHELLGTSCGSGTTAMLNCPQLTQMQCPQNGSTDGRLCNNHHHTLFYMGPEDSQNQLIPTNAGTVGTLGNNGITGTDYRSERHGSRFDMGFNTPGGDIGEMAYEQGGNKTEEQYLFDLAISVMVACILIYIMYSLLTYVFDLVSELVSQGTSAGRGVVKAEVFGESLVRHTLDLAKQAALAYATGGASLGAQAGQMGAKMAAKQAVQKMVSSRKNKNEK